MNHERDGLRFSAQWIPNRSGYLLLIACMGIAYFIFIIGAVVDVLWLLFIGLIIVLVPSIAFLLASIGTYAYVTKASVTVCVFGIPVKRMDPSRLKLICAVSNGHDPVLCLSQYSEAELADLQEKRLLKGLFTRHEVPFRKRTADWRRTFAREYLNWLLWHPLKSVSSPKFLFLNMDQAAPALIRELFPMVSSRNYLEKVYLYEKPEQVPTMALELHPKAAQLLPEGVRVLEKEKAVWFLPAHQIKTILRLDRFVSQSKVESEHSARLVACALTRQELLALAEKAPARIPLTAGADAAIVTYCMNRVRAWKKTDLQMCPLFYCEKNEKALRKLYPQAQWIDISATWQTDFDPIQTL